MKVIMDLVDKMEEELNSAEYYAEKFLESKTKNEEGSIFRRLASEEVSHAAVIKDTLNMKVDEFEKLVNLGQDTIDILEYSDRQYLARTKQIRDILTS